MPLGQERQQRLIESIISRFDTDVTKTILDIEKLINRILIREGFTEATALNFDILFIEALEESGYFTQVNDLIDNSFDELFGVIRSGLSLGGFDVLYTQDDLAKITALKNLQLQQFSSLGNEAGQILQQNLFRYVLGNFNLEDVQSQILQDFQGTNLSKFSTTLARTAIGEFQQSVIDIKAEGLDAVWLYVGVNDAKTRDFCECVLKQRKYYTVAQKNLIMADKARAFNCRHRARPVSIEFAERGGFKPTQVLVCAT